MTRGERIKEAKDHWLRQGPDRSARLLCDKVGIKEPTYYNWEGDKKTGILAENLFKFARLTGFHPRWLMEGKGPKMLADDERVQRLLDEIQDLDEPDFEAALAHIQLLKQARKSEA